MEEDLREALANLSVAMWSNTSTAALIENMLDSDPVFPKIAAVLKAQILGTAFLADGVIISLASLILPRRDVLLAATKTHVYTKDKIMLHSASLLDDREALDTYKSLRDELGRLPKVRAVQPADEEKPQAGRYITEKGLQGLGSEIKKLLQ